jgi:hypothetical protein
VTQRGRDAAAFFEKSKFDVCFDLLRSIVGSLCRFAGLW